MAWSLAVLVHELSHYIMIKLCGISVSSVCLQCSGVVMTTQAMTNKQEMLCALAGPVGGLSLLLTARWLPCTAICAFALSCYNLLPIFPLDGGRALRCVFLGMFGPIRGAQVSNIITYILLGILALLAFYVTWKIGINIFTLGVVGMVIYKLCIIKIPCKQLKQIVQ